MFTQINKENKLLIKSRNRWMKQGKQCKLWERNSANGRKDRNPMMRIYISCDRSLKEAWSSRTISQHNKGNQWQTYSQYYTKWGKIQRVSTKMRNEIWVSIFSILINYTSGNLRTIRWEKQIKGIRIRRKPGNSGTHL